MALYRHIIKKSFWLVWRNRFIWVFGFFAGLLGVEGEFGFISNLNDKINPAGTLVPAAGQITEAGSLTLQSFQVLWQMFLVDPFASFFTLFFAVLVVVITIFVIWLVVVSQGALINHVPLIEKGKKTTVQSGFDVGMKHFGPLLGINFLAKLIIFLLLFVILVPLFFVSNGASNPAIGDLYYAITFIIFVPIAFMISFTTKFAAIFIVLKKEKFWASLEKGWQLFKNNWLVSLEMAILVLLASIVAMLAFLVVGFLVSIPFIILAFVTLLMHSTAAFFFIVTLGIICVIIVMILVFSMLGSFHWSCWTMLFERLISGKEKTHGRIQRWFNP